MEQCLTVDLGDRSYPIYVGSGLLQQGQLLTQHISGKQVLVVTNETIAPLYLNALLDNLSGYEVSQLILPDGEIYKTLDTVSLIYDALLQNRHNRSTTLIALGGGVIGDMTGFAAASYQRGVNFIQIPTTLLSQVDSSVGGKTGVNHALGKNMVGAFHQPQCVIADTDTLTSLPEREFSAGLAEVIKYGALGDRDFLHWLDDNLDALLKREHQVLIPAILRSCQCKKDIVDQDERESGVRALLNFGHTFGHAIETARGYGNWLHGEAVATGMVMAADLSLRQGWLSPQEAEFFKALLRRCKLPVVPPEDITTDQFLVLMGLDKKVIDGKLRLILLKSLGKAIITSGFDKNLLSQTLACGPQLCENN